MNENQHKHISADSQSTSVMDVLVYFMSEWKWFLISVLICGAAAYLVYATTPSTYFASATVIIKDPSNKTTSAGFDRYDNYINRVNVANEILQFQSKALMREVVQRLNADVSYRVKDDLRTRELYSSSPLSVRFIGAQPSSRMDLELTPLSDTRARIDIKDPEGNTSRSLDINLGDTTVVAPGDTLLVSRTDFFTNKWIGTGINVVKQPLAEVTNRYCANLGIQQEKDEGTILKLSVTDASPRRAEDVLNTLIQVYNEEAIADKNRVAVNTADFIQERLMIIESELGGVESDIESFKKSNEIVDLNATAGRYMGESEKYSAAATEIGTQLYIANDMKKRLADPAYASDIIPANTGLTPAIESQIADYNRQRLELDRMAEAAGANPRVGQMRESIAAMRQGIVRAVDTHIAGLKVRLRDANASEARAQSRVTSIPTKERQMLSLERKQKIKESLYLFLLNRREENALSQAMADNNARIIDEAIGTGPISPNRTRIMIIGILAGLIIPALWLLARIFLDTRVRTRKDLASAVSIPILGTVPLDRNRLKAARKGREETPDPMVAEAMKIIRTNMAFMCHPGKSQLQVITLTSFSEGAGKTFVAHNLAESLASTGRKVALVDLDIRKGTLSRAYGHHTAGITDYLADTGMQLSDIIIERPRNAAFDLVPSGSIAPNPAELLMLECLDKLVNDLRDRYDFVVIDSVPVGIVADASISNRLAQLTIFVVRSGRLDRRQLPDLQALYDEHQLNNLALVLNGIDPRSRGYGYGHGYGYGYGYGHHYIYGAGHRHPWYRRIFSHRKQKK